MEAKHGIVETKEVLSAVIALAIAIAEAAKDGVDLSDLMALVGNEKVKAALALAAKNISQVPAEVSDIDLSEGLELAMALAKEVPALLAALKK